MFDFVANMQLGFDRFIHVIAAKPEILGWFLGVLSGIAGIFAYVVRSRKELQLQQRNNYFELELEASRIFTVALKNPDIPRYLRGDLDEDEKSRDPRLKEQVFWFISQELNIFEIAISQRKDKTISSELFSTWVPWFYELGTYKNFDKFWFNKPYDLMYNYKQDLQDIINTAVELKLSPGFDEDNPQMMAHFCKNVAKILKDPAIWEQCRRTTERHEQLEARLASAHKFQGRRSPVPVSQPGS
jgi:hypothetical protein